MEDKVLEFSITGCIYTGDKQVSLDDLNDKFIDWIESNGWEFCGIMKPISDEVEEGEIIKNGINDKIFNKLVAYAKELKTTSNDILNIIKKTLNEFNIEDDGIISLQLSYALIDDRE